MGEGFYDVSEKDWFLTLLLAWFGGYLGLHHFYCQKKVKGILYVLTFGLLYYRSDHRFNFNSIKKL